MRKRDTLKIEKKIISQASTTDTSLLTESYLISLQIAKCKIPYSIGEELMKSSLIAACNEVLGQSVAIKIKDIPLSNDTAERRISDMAEDTETQYIKKLKTRNYLYYNWTNLIIRIFFSIRKYVGCPAVKFSRGYMNSERKVSCF